MPISVRFRLWPVKSGKGYSNPHPLRVNITVDGVEDPGFGAVWPLDGTGEKLKVDPSKWKVKEQRSTMRDDPVNDDLLSLKAHIMAIYRNQRLIGPPTTKSIRHELSTGQMPYWSDEKGWLYGDEKTSNQPKSAYYAAGLSEQSSLADAYAAYVVGLRLKAGTAAALSPITLGRWDRGLLLINAWTELTGQSVPPVGKITVGWAKRFHAWLQAIPENADRIKSTSQTQASRFVLKISEVLTWMLEEGWLVANPVASVKWPRGADKEVRFLEPRHVQLLMRTRWEGTDDDARWWFCLMCATGLDYPDAIGYVRNRLIYETEGPAGWKIVGRRAKKPYVAYDIPLLDEVRQLFEIKPNGPHDYAPQCVNRHTNRIEEMLGIEWRITAKTARKTFGCLMLMAGYRISEVSRMMGHASIRTTERYYVKVLGSAVDEGMKRVNRKP